MAVCSCTKQTIFCHDCRRQVCPNAPTRFQNAGALHHNYLHAPTCELLQVPQSSETFDYGSQRELDIIIEPEPEQKPVARKQDENSLALSRPRREKKPPRARLVDETEGKTSKPRTPRRRPKKDSESDEKDDSQETPKTPKKRKVSKILEEKDQSPDSEKTNNRKSTKSCPRKKAKTTGKDFTAGKPEKKAPEAPRAETPSQIAFLRTFAKKPDNCTCYEADEDDDWKDILFDSQEEAELQVKALIKKTQKNSAKCDALSVLQKNGKFLILRTNSEHTDQKLEINKDDKYLRPKKEPRLTGQVVKDARFYVYKSCEACQELTPSKADEKRVNGFSLPLPPKPDFEVLRDTEMISNLDKGGTGGAIREIKSKAPKNEHCHLVLINKIRLNCTLDQNGWTLHHSEMEAYYFAKRHGWEIVVMVIDRDCCPVCGATLGSIDPALHALIQFHSEYVKAEKTPSITTTSETEEVKIVIENPETGEDIYEPAVPENQPGSPQIIMPWVPQPTTPPPIFNQNVPPMPNFDDTVFNFGAGHEDQSEAMIEEEKPD